VANEEGEDSQELERMDSSQDCRDPGQDSENGDSYGTFLHELSPFDV
jgi:hypothetical protein